MKTLLFSIFISVFMLLSCASAEQHSTEQQPPTPPPVAKIETPAPPPFFELTCKNKTISLQENSASIPLFLIVSQEHCPPCHIIYGYAQELKQRFGDRIQFVVIYNDNDEHTVEGVNFCHLTKDSNHLATPTDQFPRVVIFDENGEVVADLTGAYPELYYYGIIREVLTNQRVRALSEQSPQE